MPDTDKRIAPYLPFKTFLGSLDALSQGVPPKLDRSIWRSQSGINQGLILNAYRFFALVDPENGDASTKDLEILAKHKEKRPELMREKIGVEYSGVLESNDLTKITMKILEEAFEKEFAVSGATKQKAIAFFLKAAQFADMPLSPYLLGQLRNSAKKPRKPKQRVELLDEEEEEASDDGSPLASKAVTHTVQLASGGTVSVIVTANPFMMPLEDRNFVFSMIDMVQKYEAQKQGEK